MSTVAGAFVKEPFGTQSHLLAHAEWVLGVGSTLAQTMSVFLKAQSPSPPWPLCDLVVDFRPVTKPLLPLLKNGNANQKNYLLQ